MFLKILVTLYLSCKIIYFFSIFHFFESSFIFFNFSTILISLCSPYQLFSNRDFRSLGLGLPQICENVKLTCALVGFYQKINVNVTHKDINRSKQDFSFFFLTHVKANTFTHTLNWFRSNQTSPKKRVDMTRYQNTVTLDIHNVVDRRHKYYSSSPITCIQMAIVELYHTCVFVLVRRGGQH